MIIYAPEAHNMYLTVVSWFLISFFFWGGGGSGPSRANKFLYAPAPPPPSVWALKPPSWALLQQTTKAPMIYAALYIMFWMHAYPLLGQVGGVWALEFESFLSPVKWHRNWYQTLCTGLYKSKVHKYLVITDPHSCCPDLRRARAKNKTKNKKSILKKWIFTIQIWWEREPGGEGGAASALPGIRGHRATRRGARDGQRRERRRAGWYEQVPVPYPLVSPVLRIREPMPFFWPLDPRTGIGKNQDPEKA